MDAKELLQLIEQLEAEYWDITREDMHWLADYDSPEAAKDAWYENNQDWRNEIPTAAERNI